MPPKQSNPPKKSKVVHETNLCPHCEWTLVWVPDIMLHHCFNCGGFFVVERLKNAAKR